MRPTLTALAIMVSLPMSGCRLVGIERMACEQGEPKTCPDGMSCVDGLCAEEDTSSADAGAASDGGAQPDAYVAPTPELLADDQPGVQLMALHEDGSTLFWATSGPGGCIRCAETSGIEDVFCEEGTRQIAGLALADGRVFWLSRDPTLVSEGRLMAVADTARDTDGPIPSMLDDGLTLRPLADGGPALLAALHDSSSDQVAVAYVANADDSAAVRRLLLSGDAVDSLVNYRGIVGADAEAAVALTADDLFFVVDEVYASIVCRRDHESDTDGIIQTSYDDGAQDFPDGQGWAVTTTGDGFWASTRDDLDRGGILHSTGASDGGWLLVEQVLASVDPQDPAKYASAIDQDAGYLYYATTGAGSSSSKLFRLSTGAADPELLLELTVPAGALLLTGTHVYWSEPSTGRIMQLAR